MTEQLSPDDKATSVVFDHCVRVYREMEAQSRVENVEDAVWLVYEGYLTKLFGSLQLSTPYYTKVREMLKVMGCIEQLRRGGGNTPSRWRLVREPNEESFNSFVGMKHSSGGRLARAEQELRSAHKRITSLDNRIERLEGVVATILPVSR
jgi:hypothetical protein